MKPLDNPNLAATALELLPNEAVLIDARGEIVLVNSRWRQFAFENGAAETLMAGTGANYLDACRRAAQDNAPLAAEALAGIKSVLSGDLADFTLEYPCPAPGEARWFVLYATTFPPLQGAVITHVEITERKLRELAMWDAAHHDGLTGALNRRGLEMMAHRLLSSASDDSPVQLIFVDVDGLKMINDRFGHLAGDAVLRVTAKALMHEEWHVGRLGGDEFASIQAVRGPVNPLAYIKQVRSTFRSESGELPASISVGHAVAPQDGSSWEALLSVADSRMYSLRYRARRRSGLLPKSA